MPSTEVELHHGYKSLYWVVYLGHLEKGVGVCHEAGRVVRCLAWLTAALHLLRYPFQHRSFFQDESGESNPREVGARP